MTIRVLVNGKNGKMGRPTVAAIEADPALTLAGTAGHDDDLAKVIQDNHAQVVVDFTTPTSVFANTQTIINSGAHPVIGTTGLLPTQIAELQTQCRKLALGGIIAPNFSIGAALMMQISKQIAAHFCHAEIIEAHHVEKLDAPSGTAIKTAEMIAAGRTTTPLPPHSTEVLPHARGATHEHVPIHSVRLPGVVADQTVTFGGHHETLTISHNTLDRACFMPGVVLACKAVVELEELLYGLETIL